MLASGISSGIQSQISSIAASAAAAVKAAIAAARAEGDIHSPSKKAEDLVGVPIVQGAARGIDKATHYMERSSRAMVNVPFRQLSSVPFRQLASVPLGDLRASQTVSNVTNTTNAPVTVTINATVRSEDDYRRIAKEVTREQNREMRRRGMR